MAYVVARVREATHGFRLFVLLNRRWIKVTSDCNHYLHVEVIYDPRLCLYSNKHKDPVDHSSPCQSLGSSLSQAEVN